MIAGLAVFNAVRDVLEASGSPEQACIKWPNDIYIGGRKLCGILSEMIAEETRIVSIIIGIGINVNSDETPENAVSIKNITGTDTGRNEFLSSIIKYFNSLFSRYEKGGFSGIFMEWKSSLGWIGRDVSFNDGLRVVSGRLRDVDENGAVVIETSGGEMVFYSGDMTPGRFMEPPLKY
jgi:BirA family biotin operon repressor/biotin-[acetyl-CoA-carboxylase] ligase